MTMRRLPVYRQTPGYCGPTALRMVLAYFDIKKTETELARQSRCTRARGVTAERLLGAARSLGLTGNIKDNATLADLQRWVVIRRIPVIVDWFSGDESHFAVVANVAKGTLTLHDPDGGLVRRIPWTTFRRIWFIFRGTDVPSRTALRVRRMLVVYPAPR